MTDLVSLLSGVRRAVEEGAGVVAGLGDAAQGSSAPSLSIDRVEVSIPVEVSALGVRTATPLGARRSAVTTITLTFVPLDTE